MFSIRDSSTSEDIYVTSQSMVAVVSLVLANTDRGDVPRPVFK